ncbi:MAG: pepN 2, partial [Acidobacteria bacterium]|nr:pepN 2 [Acidobacteriota bacterium]
VGVRAGFSIFVALLVCATPAAAQRLSGSVTPEHYTLWFAPDLEQATFRGRESIRVQLRAPARAITLHAVDVEFGEVTIEAAGGTQPARVTLDAGTQTATLTVPRQVPAGAATIRMTYRGILNDRLRGFYLSRANGRRYAVTQMEPTDARRAFPSFDEPMYKAAFEISMTIGLGDTAISNGAQVSDVPGPEPGTHTVSFATTPKMSTYLVAMIVGDFVCRSGASDGTPIRVCSTPDKLALTAFALEAAEQQVAFYNAYFGITYPFGKLDIVAVPDFAAGAMENSGAITFRERLLLVDQERASLDSRKRVASILSHEIAHQWFGNLVTMTWWNDIWLNEGFATWIASRPLAQWHPEWNVDLDDAADTQTALGLDALRSTRAIRIDVDTPDEINEVFDGIAYEKTAGVLRMIEAFVGVEAFRKGIASYLAAHAYGNAGGEDFWNEMTRVTGRPIDRIMRGYVEQPGVPVVAVQTRCTGPGTDVTLSQNRFVGTPGASAPGGQLWDVPVCFKANDGQPRCEVLDRRRQTLSLPGCANVFANTDSRGYYLTRYAPDAVRALARRARELTPIERISLLGDEWWMVRAGHHDIGVYLDLAGSLAGDETAAVTDAMATRLAFTGEYLVAPGQRSRYEGWIRARFGPALDALGLPGDARDTEERHSRRAGLLGLVGTTGNDVAVQRRARELGARYLADPSSLPGTLVPAVLRMAAATGDATLYEQYLAQLETLAAQPEEYYRFFTALSWFGDPALVRRTLAFAISPAVRTQDTGTLIAGLLARPASRADAWTFVQAEWPTLTRKLGTFQGIPTIIGALGNFCSAESAAQVRRFFAKNPVPAAERTLQQVTERIDNCAALVARQSPALAAWPLPATR